MQTEASKYFTQSKFLVIYNPLAGKGRALKEKNSVVHFFEQHAIRYTLQTTTQVDFSTPYNCIVIIGGDGTLNYLLNKKIPFQVPILLIKGGTGNDFYSHLYGKIKTTELLNTLFQQYRLQSIDLGQCNAKYFINGIGLGFDAAVVQTNNAKKFIRGKLGYLIDVLLNLFLFKEQLVSFKINNEKPELQSLFMLTIANGKTYGGGFKVAPNALSNDGLLECIAVAPIPKWKRLLLLPIMERGKHLSLKKVSYQQINTCEISSTQTISIHLDGELMLGTNFTISLLPAQLQFLVP